METTHHPLLVQTTRRQHITSARCWCRPYAIDLFGKRMIIHQGPDDGEVPIQIVMLDIRSMNHGETSHLIKAD